MKHFINVTSLEDLKKQYRKLALANHPDKGGNTEVMQEINVEFDVLFKIWQSKPTTEKKEEPTTRETAREYRRKFYTANGWEGSRYDFNLSTTEIAARVREYTKTKWPQYKFSVRTEYYSGGSSIHLKLVSGPEKAFKEGATQTYISTMENVRGFKKELTEIVYNVMNDVCDYMQSYNYDDSDGMIDYFNTNFYSEVYIGAWNKPYEVKTAKAARIKERDENKEINKNGELEIVDYSEKAVAVFGDTKPVKEKLNELGGRFNPRLNYNGEKRAGWVFPKSKRLELESMLKGIDTGKEQEKQISEIREATINMGNNNSTSDKEDRPPMNAVAFTDFISCVQKRATQKGYLYARNHVKEELKKHSMKFIQLKYIVFLLSEYKKRNEFETITGVA